MKTCYCSYSLGLVVFLWLLPSVNVDVHRLRPELYRCNLCWKDDWTLLIGWASSIKVEGATF